MNQFVGRDSEIQQLEDFLRPKSTHQLESIHRRRQVYVVHGLGGIGKTQLVIEFARRQHKCYSAVLWLDGSSKDSLTQSFTNVARSLPKDELAADMVQELRSAMVDTGAMREGVSQWLSLPSNQHWLLIFDNVDRDHNIKDNPQAYNVKDFFPSADHGSIIITSRLSNLQHTRSLKLGIVDDNQAMAILENSAGPQRQIKGNEMPT